MSSYDHSFGPRIRIERSTWLTYLALLLLVLVIVIFPNYKIAKQITRTARFALPMSVEEGQAFTIPRAPEIETLSVDGWEPSAQQRPAVFIAAAGFGGPERLAVAGTYKKTLTRWDRLPFSLIYSSPKEIFFREIPVDRLPRPEERAQIRLPASVVQKLRDTEQRLIVSEKKIMDAALSQNTPSQSLSCWQSPLQSVTTGEFATPRSLPSGENYYHLGWDLRAAIGTPIKAPGLGQTVLTDIQTVSGETVVIDHGGGFFSRYFHLSHYLTKPRERVGTNQLIAFSGNTGRSEAPHLHWEVLWHGQNLNPESFLVLSQQLCDLK